MQESALLAWLTLQSDCALSFKACHFKAALLHEERIQGLLCMSNSGARGGDELKPSSGQWDLQPCILRLSDSPAAELGAGCPVSCFSGTSVPFSLDILGIRGAVWDFSCFT